MSGPAAKIQKIGGSRVPNSKSGAIAVSFIEEPAEPALLASRGSMYAIADFAKVASSGAPLLSRLLWDTLQESYFGNLEGTPMQSLEKAVAEVSSRLLGLRLNPLTDLEGGAPRDLNMAIVVKWGKYLYTAIIGGCKIFLIRGLGVKGIAPELSLDSSFSSQVLESEDIVIIASKPLAESINPENLINRLGTIESDLLKDPEKEDKLLLVIKSNSPEEERSDKSQKMTGLLNGLGRAFKRRSGSLKSSRNFVLGLVVVVLGVALLGSLTLSFKQKKQSQAGSSAVLGDSTFNLSQLLTSASDTANIDSNRAKEYLTQAEATAVALSPEVKRSPEYKELAQSLQNLKVDLYQIQILPSFKEASMPASIYFDRGTVATTKLAGFPFTSYYSTLYILDVASSQIQKMTSAKSISPWLVASVDLTRAVDIAIDGEVWVLTADSVKRFFKGASKELTLSGFDKPFKDPKAIFTDIDTNNLYVWDSGNSRLIVFNKTGNYQFQILLPSLPIEAHDLTVSEATKTFTLVGDTKAISGTWQ